MTRPPRRRGQRRKPNRSLLAAADELPLATVLETLREAALAASTSGYVRDYLKEIGRFENLQAHHNCVEDASTNNRCAIQPRHVLPPLSRIASGLADDLRVVRDAEHEKLLRKGLFIALKAVNLILKPVSVLPDDNSNMSKEVLSTHGQDMKQTVELSVGPLSEAISVALFPPTSVSRMRSDWKPGSGTSGIESPASNISNDHISVASRVFQLSRGVSSVASSSESDMLLGDFCRLSSSTQLSPIVSLRLSALDALAAIARISSLSVVPHWSRFMPEKDGLYSYVYGNVRQQSLGNIILYDRNELIRSAAVGTVTALLVGSWHFTRARRSKNGANDSPVSLRTDGKVKSLEVSSQAFVSARDRVLQASVALFSIVATAIRNERSAKVLSRLMKLAAELSFNAQMPSIPRSSIVALIRALENRITDMVHMDYTSRSAALSCLGGILTSNANHISRPAIDLRRTFQVILDILRSPEAPIAESLAGLQGLMKCDPLLGLQSWNDLGPMLRTIFASSPENPIVRLHVMRFIENALCFASSPEPIATFQNKTLQDLECGSSEIELRESCSCFFENLLDVHVKIVDPALCDSFHSVRACALQCVEHVFRMFAMLPEICISSALARVCQIFLEDDSPLVRAQAARTLQCAPVMRNDGYRFILHAYDILLQGLENEKNLNVRGKCILAIGNIIVQNSLWLDLGSADVQDYDVTELCSRFYKLIMCLIDERVVVPATQSPDAQKSDHSVDVCARANALWALGVFIRHCTEHGSTSPVKLTRSILPAEQLDDVVSNIAKIVSNEMEAPKVRWNGCHALAQLRTIMPAEIGTCECTPHEAATSRGNLHTYVPVVTNALCTALESETNFKVRISAAKALTVLTCNWTAVDQNILQCILVRAASSSFESHVRGGCSTTLPTDFATREAQISAFNNEHSALVVELLLRIDGDAFQHFENQANLSCNVLFGCIWNQASLPAYALKALKDVNSSNVTPANREETAAATELWTSLPYRLKEAINCSVKLASCAKCNSMGRKHLLAAGRIVS